MTFYEFTHDKSYGAPLQPSAALLSTLVAFAINIIQLTWHGNAQKEVQDIMKSQRKKSKVFYFMFIESF